LFSNKYIFIAISSPPSSPHPPLILPLLFLFFLFLPLLSILRFELRALNLVGKHSTIWAAFPALIALVNFWIGSCFLRRASFTSQSPYLCLVLHLWTTLAALLIEMRVSLIFAWVGLEL
jgi:hypothetical protein